MLQLSYKDTFLEVMKVQALSSPITGLLLLFALLCGRFMKASSTAPGEWATVHLEYNPMTFNCTGQGLEIRPSYASTVALLLSSRDLPGIQRSYFFPRLPSVGSMNLSHRCIVEVREAAFTEFWDLQELDLSSNRLHIIRDGTFKGLGGLKTLDLRHNRISEVHRNAFNVLDAVQIVWLQNNDLDTIPEAISGLVDLRVLSMANNQISWVDSRSFFGCRSLTALHLQNNSISEVSVDAFKHLMKLQMLNLATNLLETMPSSTLESLWEQGTDIHLHGNLWRCNCSLAELRGRAPTWLTGRVQCHGGVLHGVPLSSLALRQLMCKRTWQVSRTLATYIMEGTDLRIPCGNASERGEAQYWHTPFGRLESTRVQISGQPVAMLRDGSVKITNVTPYHTGLYYCLRAAEDDWVIHPNRVECTPRAISGGGRQRKAREAKGYEETVSADHFAAAVTSAVVVTFLVGFPIGAFSRTYVNQTFHKLRRRLQLGSSRGDMGTVAWHYENNTYQKGGGSEDMSWSEARLQGVLPEASADLGAPYLEGNYSGRESQGEGGAQSGTTGGEGGRGPLGNEGEGPAEETEPSRGRNARPSKRRVIKVYNYDEEGNKYGHIRDPEDEGAPAMKQRSLSLTRLNAIMASATAPAFSKEPLPGGTVEPTDPGDGKPVFHLSI